MRNSSMVLATPQSCTLRYTVYIVVCNWQPQPSKWVTSSTGFLNTYNVCYTDETTAIPDIYLVPCIENPFIVHSLQTHFQHLICTHNGTMALSAASLCSVDQEEKDESQLSINEGRGGDGCSEVSPSSWLKRWLRADTAALWSTNTELLLIEWGGGWKGGCK